MGDPASDRRRRLRRASTLLLVVGVGALVLAAGLGALLLRGGEDGDRAAAAATADPRTRDPAVPRARVDRVDGKRLLGLVRLQLGYGNRPAGSRALRELRPKLVARMPRGRTEAVPGHPGLANVVGTIPGRRPAIVLAAHYDTEALPRDFVGANDGAAGTAAVLAAARAVAARPRGPRDREVRFVLFDGEEEPPGTDPADFEEVALRGSKAYARRHARDVSSLTLLDYVGNRGLRLPREGGSDERLWGRWRAAARRVGTDAIYRGESGVEIIDDHVPFLDRGVPAIDLIDWDYEHADTSADTYDKLSRDALDAVTETAVQWVLDERRR